MPLESSSLFIALIFGFIFVTSFILKRTHEKMISGAIKKPDFELSDYFFLVLGFASFVFTFYTEMFVPRCTDSLNCFLMPAFILFVYLSSLLFMGYLKANIPFKIFMNSFLIYFGSWIILISLVNPNDSYLHLLNDIFDAYKWFLVGIFPLEIGYGIRVLRYRNSDKIDGDIAVIGDSRSSSRNRW